MFVNRRGRARSALCACALAITAACATHRAPGSALPALPAPPALSSLQTALDTILAEPALTHGTWGVLVKSLKTGETLYAFNAQKLLLPASNMKVVTLAAAAERLGWDHTFETRLLAAGRIDGGTLAGDLVVAGSGDPSVMVADGSAARLFDDWAGALKARGIRTISGRIVGDDRAFDDLTLGFGWSWDDLPDDYAAGVGALQFNESAVRVTVTPGPASGDFAAIAIEPPGSGIGVVSRVTTGAAGSATAIATSRLPGRQRLELAGTIAAGAAPATLTVSVDNPTLFFVEALRHALIARGIDVRGAAVDVGDLDDPPPANATLVAAHRSPPLSTLAVRLMKVSQNQYAETLLKALSPPGAPATAERGRAAARATFDAWGIASAGLIQRDGSGLSRYDFVSAETLVAILAHVWTDDRLRGPFEASLPVLGQDGTLANRLKGTPAEGRVHAKTGSMSQVRALSGYVTSGGGEPLVFAILANNFDTPADVVNRASDRIVIALAQFQR